MVIASGREKDAVIRIAHGESLGTRFLPSCRRESRERWMLSGLSVKGDLTVDEGAAVALAKQNRSLLAAGIRYVKGTFARGDIVNILDISGWRLGCGIVNYDSNDLNKIIGARSDKIGEILGHDFGAEIVHRDNLALLGPKS